MNSQEFERFFIVLDRIARVQEQLLLIAAEARAERLKLSTKMQEALKRPMQEKP